MANLITEHIDIWTTAQTQKNNVGRGRGKNSNGQSPHGIKKLRELILELAVRGKLVPQDPNDEPASMLLEKVAEEKARLIKEGKIKKQKPFPEISEDEKPFDLPDGWEWIRLQQIIQISSGDGLTAANMKNEGGIPVYGGNGVTGYHDQANVIKPTLVIGRVGYYCGSVHITPASAWITDNAFKTAFSENNIYINFLYWLLNGTNLKENENATAQPVISGRKVYPIVVGLPPTAEQHRIVAKVDELIALCDHLEQQQTDNNDTHKIIVENLLATLTNTADQREFVQAWQRIANHFDTLFTTEHSIDQLKQTILQLAVMGKLVPQDPIDLPAPQSGKFFVYALECEDKSIYIGQTNDILNRWKEHATGKGADWTKKHPPLRLVHWEEYNSREEAITREKELKTGFGRKWLKRELAAGRTRQAGEPASVLLDKIAKDKAQLIKEGKIKKQKPLPEISEEEKSFELPNGWEWARLQTLVFLLGDGLHGTPNYTPGTKYYFVNGNNLNNGKIEIKPSTKSVSFEEMLKHKKDLSTNTVLVSINGTLGNVAFYNDEKIILGKSACYFNLSEYVSKHFIKKVIESPYFMSYAFRNATGSTIKNLSLKAMNGFPVLLPPLAEQQRIVAKVDELIALCDALKASLNDAQTSQVQLADVIVEQAVLRER